MSGRDERTSPQRLDTTELDRAAGGAELLPAPGGGIGLGLGGALQGSGATLPPGVDLSLKESEATQTRHETSPEDTQQFIEDYRDMVQDVLDTLQQVLGSEEETNRSII